MISHAQRSVDVAELWPPPKQDFAFPLIDGLRAAVQKVGVANLTVRVLIGVYPGAIPLGFAQAGLACLKRIFGDLSQIKFCRSGAIDAEPALYADYLREAVNPKLRVQVAFTFSDRLTSWDHEKLLDVDGREAIVGGMNYWTDDYLRTTHPVNDVSMQIEGPAAGDALEFNNVLWSWTCANRPGDVSLANLTSCVRTVMPTPFGRPPAGCRS